MEPEFFWIDKESSKRVLKVYLGEYFVEPIKSPAIIKHFEEDFLINPKPIVGYQVNGLNQFRQVVRALILFHRSFLEKPFIEYKVCESYKDILNEYLNPEKDSENESIIKQLSKPDLLIIYTPKVVPPNKLLWTLCHSIAESRSFHSTKKTVFINFKSEPLIEKDVEFKIKCF